MHVIYKCFSGPRVDTAAFSGLVPEAVNLHIRRCETSDLPYFLSISISGSHDGKQILFADPKLQPAAVVVHQGRQILKYT